MELKRVCTRCDQELPLAEFPKRQGVRSGMSPVCRRCLQEAERMRRGKNAK